MTATLTMIRRGTSLVPATQMDLDDLQMIPEGKALAVSWKRTRSLPHLRLFFAKLRKLCQSGSWENDQTSLLDYIKIGVGHVHTVIDNSSSMVSGAVLAIAETLLTKYGPASDEGRLAKFVISIAGPKAYLVPKSISFSALGQDEFNDFDRRSDKFIQEKFGVDLEELMREAAPLAASTLDAEEPTELLTREEPVAEPPTSPGPLAARLEALASDLSRDTPDNVETAWSEAWASGEAKELFHLQPKCVEAIVKFARMRAGGQLASGEAGYREMTGKAIAAALERRKAA